MPLIPELGRQRQAEFKASLVYTASSGSARAIQWDCVLEGRQTGRKFLKETYQFRLKRVEDTTKWKEDFGPLKNNKAGWENYSSVRMRNLFSFYFCVCVFMFLYIFVCRGPEDNLWESFLFYHMGPLDKWTQVIQVIDFDGKFLYSLRYLASQNELLFHAYVNCIWSYSPHCSLLSLSTYSEPLLPYKSPSYFDLKIKDQWV